MMELYWSREAEDDLEAIVLYIEGESVLNAMEFDERVKDRVEMLLDFPETGKPGRIGGTRELISPRDRYCLIYQVQEGVVTILRVIHGGQRWPA